MITAHHEAGHVLLAEFCGARVTFASIIPDHLGGARAEGMTKAVWPPFSDPRVRADRLVRVALAGPAAELIYSGEQYEPEILPEWCADWSAACVALQMIVPTRIPDAQKMQILSRYLVELIQFLSIDDVWDTLAAVADELDAHEVLEEEQLGELRAEGRLAVRPVPGALPWDGENHGRHGASRP